MTRRTLIAADIWTTPYIKAGVVLGVFLVITFFIWFASVVEGGPDDEPQGARELSA